MRHISALVLALCAFSAAKSFGEEPSLKGLEAALSARDSFVTRFQNGDGATTATQVAQEVTKTVVMASIGALRTQGDTALANRFEREWNEQHAKSLSNLTLVTELDALGITVKDLGDHRALSTWLSNFYEKLRTRMGAAAIHQGLLGDIWAVNHAIPVVIAPRSGLWRQDQRDAGILLDRDWVEYRKHFIPLVNVATYYAASFACKRYAVPAGFPQNQCAKAAGLLRHVMGRYISPKISDFVFKMANRQPVQWTVSQSDLRYTSAAELARALGQ